MARIMLVTGDDVMRRYLGEKLKRAGHFVTRIGAYDTALTVLSETLQDVLLVGVGADEAEGLAFAHEARVVDPDMRVVFITGFSIVPLLVQDGDEDGLYDRLGEPAHLGRLVQEVGRLLAA